MRHAAQVSVKLLDIEAEVVEPVDLQPTASNWTFINFVVLRLVISHFVLIIY